jgi:uncharacterized protein YndB with AHSA1/START domain
MKILLIASLALVVLGLLAGLAGLLLPVTRTASATREIAAPPEGVWRLITDVAAQPGWRPELAAVEVLDATPGRERWIERPRGGPAIRFQTERQVAPTEWTIVFSGPAEGRWTGRLEPLPDNRGTRLSVEEIASVRNPWMRLLARLVFDPQVFVDAYLRQVAAEAEKGGR